MSKKHAYKVGDRVRIVNCRPIKRVGYPLYAPDLYAEFEDHPRLVEALKMLGVMGENSNCTGRAKRDAVRGLAQAAVRFRGWGGGERTVHYYPVRQPGEDIISSNAEAWSDCTGWEATVLERRVRMTGTYFAPRGGQSYDGEFEYEPGGLFDMKAHVILSTSLGDFEACDVEPVDA